MGGGSSTQDKTVKANKSAVKANAKGKGATGKSEPASLKSRKQQQEDEIARARQARENLLQAEQEAAERANEEKLRKMKHEQEQYLASQKAQEQQQMQKQATHATPVSTKPTPVQQKQTPNVSAADKEAQKLAEMKALMAERKKKEQQQAENRMPPPAADKSPQIMYAHNDLNLNKNAVLGKKQAAPIQQQINRQDSESDDEPSQRFARQQPPAAQVFVSKVNTMNYNNVAGTAQVTKQPQVNTVMAGFVQEEELIEDSENQRNIDMSELKNLLL